jgi:ribonucleoside-diphosphate reductase alpha chain
VNNYEPTGLALDIFRKRYAIHENETFAEACDRVAYHIAQAEQGDKIAKVRSEFADILKRNLFFPGGRIMYGSGRPKGQLLNCFVIPTADSREGWGRTAHDVIIISGTGGGVGKNYSPIRPRGSKINGAGGTATGAVSCMRINNSIGEELKGGGGRRVAMMMALNLTHGDIVEFLDAKLDLGQLNNANVSVIFDENPEHFFEKVKNNEDLELKHNGKIIGRVPAKKIWSKIIANALKAGEPGLLNGYLANKMSNVWYYTPLISTNPCGEIWLAAYDSCCLGSLVLPRFVDEEKKEIKWDELKRATALGVRFLDNVLSVNNYPLPEIKDQTSNIRRIGLGVTGLHDMLLKLGLKYNAPAGLELVDKVMEKIKYAAYEASIDLAEEKGSFPKFDPENFVKSGFCKTLKPSLRERIRTKGMRNCAVMTVAPVGTGSMVCDTSSGVEPMFAPAYKRKFRDGDALKEEVVIHPLFARFLLEGRGVKHFQGAHDLRVRDHFEMQRVVQKHIDNAVSKTINLPPGVSEDELSDLYMEFFPELKGVTVYPEGSRENQPLTPMDLEDAIKFTQENPDALLGAAGLDNCKDGKCDL